MKKIVLVIALFLFFQNAYAQSIVNTESDSARWGVSILPLTWVIGGIDLSLDYLPKNKSALRFIAGFYQDNPNSTKYKNSADNRYEDKSGMKLEFQYLPFYKMLLINGIERSFYGGLFVQYKTSTKNHYYASTSQANEFIRQSCSAISMGPVMNYMKTFKKYYYFQATCGVALVVPLSSGEVQNNFDVEIVDSYRKRIAPKFNISVGVFIR
jgi:hypothetical protein